MFYILTRLHLILSNMALTDSLFSVEQLKPAQQDQIPQNLHGFYLLSTVLSMNPFSLNWKSSWAASSLASPPKDQNIAICLETIVLLDIKTWNYTAHNGSWEVF